MTRIVAAADLHIGATHLTDTADQERAIDAVYDVVNEQHVDVLLLAGDLTHHRRPTPETLRMLGRFFEKVTALGVDIVDVGGNHDPEVPGVVQFFRGRGRVHVVDLAPGIVRIGHEQYSVDVAAMPYLPDRWVRAQLNGSASREETAAALTAAARDIVRGLLARRSPGVPMLFVGHGTVAGTETSSGYSMGFVGGTEWRFAVEDLAEFDVAVVGHIHRHQAPAPNVVVPGSLLPLDFSETQPHGVIVADVAREKSTWEFVEIPTPKVATYELVAQNLRDLGEPGLPDYVQGELIRVRLQCDEETARIWPPSRIERILLAAGARRVQVELTVDRGDRARDAEMTSELPPLAALERYLDAREDIDEPARVTIARCAAAAVGEVLDGTEAAGVGDLRVARVQVTNLLGIADADLYLSDVGLGALVAPVGMGKSTLGADAIRFALFGATRQGARASERLVRAGEREAAVSLDLEGNAGAWRIVRKLKIDARGHASQSLDVLEQDPAIPFEQWRPLSSGKIVDGEAQVARILGGLGDRALTAANLVVQRQGNVFAAARPEERKELLAEAGGLDVYTDLGLLSAKHLNEADKELAKLEASATTLRDRAQSTQRLEGERTAAAIERDVAASAVQGLEREHTRATELLEKAQERAAELERVSAEALRTQEDIERVDAAIAEWAHKAGVARQILSRKAQLEEARQQLAGMRAEVERLERELAEANTAARRRSDQQARIAGLDRDLAGERALRERALTATRATLHTERVHLEDLRASGCLERCTHAAACTVASSAATARQRIQVLECDERVHSEVSPRELDLDRQIVQLRGVMPDAGDVDGISAELLLKREQVKDLERQTGLAEKLAAAEQVLQEHDEQVAKLRAELEPLRRKRGDLNTRLLALGSARGERDRAVAEQSRLANDLSRTRTEERRASERVALLDGRLEELRAAAAELVILEAAITSGAREVAAWKELIVAWRACRVMVLETSVIPAVEDMANEVLHRFPYGLQLRFATQREKKGGDGLAETLDIEVLGGKGPVYELLSGGQQMALDCALHLAIALVVFRRQRSRLGYLFLDEPEGLDEPGRAAFAAIARWMHETFGGTTLVASHHADLIDALGGELIRIEGEPGNARVGAAMAEAA